MKIHKLKLSTEIKAEKSLIWKTLWEEGSYRDWVKVFGEGSYMEVEIWEENSKVLFLDPDKNGIYSTIVEYIPNQLVRFKHIGNVAKGEEQPIDEETKKWSGALEEYRIEKGEDFNTLIIEIDILDEHLDFMKEKLPLALEKIKNNCSL